MQGAAVPVGRCVMTGPFAAAADGLAGAGWFPLPLPARRKTPPPKGTTGKLAPFPDDVTLTAWLASPEHRAGNVGVRLGDDQVGIDVDAHSGKPGGDTLAELVGLLGPLPATYVSTSKLDGVSGIRHYRIPLGVEFPGELTAPSGIKAIEFIQWFHRYAVVPPSIHPDTGDQYLWIGPDGELLDKPPHVDDLPDLPAAWVSYFRRDQPTLTTAEQFPADPLQPVEPSLPADTQAVGPDGWSAPIVLDHGRPSDAVDRVLGRFVRELRDGRHPAARDATLALERLRERGYPGVDAAMDTARTLFLAAVTRAGSGNVRSTEQAEREWSELVAGARPLVASKPGTAPLYAEIHEADPPHVSGQLDAQLDGGEWRGQLIDGADWLAEGGTQPDPIWGDTSTMLAVRGQATLIAGPQGAGKTTLGQRLLLGVLGVPGYATLLGLPVAPIEGRALYLAADRPEQARLSMLRMVCPEQVRDRLVIWKGPPPGDIKKNPSVLLQLAEAAGAGFVLLDSLKDLAIKLTDDEVGASMNMAVQMVVRAGIEVVGLHHPRKLGGEDSTAKPRKLDDLYGSTWLTSGCGSVLNLHPVGNDVVELEQFKSPNGTYATLTLRHDPTMGTMERTTGSAGDLYRLLAEAGAEGATVGHLARCTVGSQATDKQLDAARKRTRRALDKLLEDGSAERVPGVAHGSDAQRYRAVEL